MARRFATVAIAVLFGLVATTVLAKHDENYVPKELADELKKQGLWQHDKAKPAK